MQNKLVAHSIKQSSLHINLCNLTVGRGTEEMTRTVVHSWPKVSAVLQKTCIGERVVIEPRGPRPGGGWGSHQGAGRRWDLSQD